MKRIFALTYAMLAYAFFWGAFLYAIFFVGNVLVSRTIDSGLEASLPTAIGIDLALLGMGADGHTASLFPGTTALAVRDALCAATWVEKLTAFRVTLTFPVFDNAACVLFLACGADKAAALKLATCKVVTSDTPPTTTETNAPEPAETAASGAPSSGE